MAARPDDLDMRALLPRKEERERMYADWLAEDIGRGDITTDFLIPATAGTALTRDDPMGKDTLGIARILERVCMERQTPDSEACFPESDATRQTR